MLKTEEYTAIDPLRLIFSDKVYAILAEKLHPHVPKVAEIQEAVRGLSIEEKTFALARAKSLIAYAKAVEEAITTTK